VGACWVGSPRRTGLLPLLLTVLPLRTCLFHHLLLTSSLLALDSHRYVSADMLADELEKEGKEVVRLKPDA
jgi:hypothetical protein